MSKKIGVYLNDEGETISLNESGIVKVYIKENGEWSVVQEVEFSVSEAKGIQRIREKCKELVQVLGECKVLIGCKITGIPYTVLDSMGFNLWELDGRPEGFLDYVLENETPDKVSKSEKVEDIKKEILPIETDKEGYYFINLKELQENNTKITSKQVLLPFLRNNNFYELEIVCSHTPPWLDKEFEALNLNCFIVQNSSNEYKVKVYHKTCNE